MPCYEVSVQVYIFGFIPIAIIDNSIENKLSDSNSARKIHLFAAKRTTTSLTAEEIV